MSLVDNKKIIRNTMLLYVRMILLMIITLYTSRVILSVLGISDYGIYCLVGGFISLFSFISNSIVAAIQRYFNVALGERDEGKYQRIYIMGINMIIIFSLMLLIIGETIGLWFVNNRLNIPDGRESSVIWVYQISLITLIVQLFRSPNHATIIAHEKMDFYAYLSIIEAVLKLATVYLLQIFNIDKLILYVLLYLIITIVINIIYKIYCTNHFNTCKYKLLWDSSLLKDLMSFSGWALFSNGSRTITMQGENIFLNQNYSVNVNAARGVASQVYNAVNTFLTNFQTAFRPQLIKTYAAHEMVQHYNLLYRSSKFSFFLLLTLVIPIIYNLDIILDIWLVAVPPYTKEFCVFVLLAYLADALATPLGASIYANGNIKKLQISISIVFLIQLIASYFALRAKLPPYIVSVFILLSHSIHYMLYVYFCVKLCKLQLKDYLRNIILPIIPVCILSVLIPTIIHINVYNNLFISLLWIMIEVLWILVVIWVIGINKQERQYIKGLISSLISKVKIESE